MADESESGAPRAPMQSSGQICQHCGVTVAPGYPKCPKCHGAMPKVSSPLARHGSKPAGGTSAAGDSGSLAMWIALLTVAVVVGAVIFFVMRGGDSDSAGQTAALARDAGDSGDTGAGTGDLVEELPADEGDAGAAVTADEALDALERDLAERRLYSGVEISGDDETIVRIESAHCEDAGMRDAIDAATSALTSAGFVGVQCYTRHGTRLFETGL